MRFISRSVFLALAAVVAMSAVGAASASAAECPGSGGGNVALCIEGKEQSAEAPFNVTKSPHGFALELDILESSVRCGNVEGKGAFNSKGTNLAVSTTLTGTSCYFTSGTLECEVKPIVLDGGGYGLKGEFSGETASKVKLAPVKGRTVGEITIIKLGQRCPWRFSNSPLTLGEGERLTIGTGNAIEAEGLTHIVWDENAATRLEFDEHSAKMEVFEASLALSAPYTGEKWSIQKS